VANDVHGFYITATANGQERLLYAERFAKPKRMERAGDEIRIRLPDNLPGQGPLMNLGLFDVAIIDDQGRDLKGGPGVFPFTQEDPPRLRKLLEALNDNLAARTFRRRVSGGRPRDPKVAEWHNEAFGLHEQSGWSYRKIQKHLKSKGIHVTLDAVRKACKRREQQ
jgi:hypothetical protein